MEHERIWPKAGSVHVIRATRRLIGGQEVYEGGTIMIMNTCINIRREENLQLLSQKQKQLILLITTLPVVQ